MHAWHKVDQHNPEVEGDCNVRAQVVMCNGMQVHPAWQRGGLGRALVERLVAALVADGVNAVNLYAEHNVVRMYEKLGFKQEPAKVQGLSFQRTSTAGAALVASCSA